MMHTDWWLFWLGGLILCGAWALYSLLLSPNAKLRRRRRKSYGRIHSTSNRPSVRFSVKSPKK